MGDTAEELTVRMYRRNEDRSPLRRFWYAELVTAQGRYLDEADHERQELGDCLEDRGEIFVTLSGRRVVGSAICTPSMRGGLGDLEMLYDMARLGDEHPSKTAVITKHAFSPVYRTCSVMLQLYGELFRRVLLAGLRHVLTGCDEKLLPFLLSLGFLPWGPSIMHPDLGRIHVLRLDCRDIRHLSSMRSPLLAASKENLQ